MEAVEVRQAGDIGESGLGAQVWELREAFVKLAANVMWRSGVPLAVEVARGTTAIARKMWSPLSRWSKRLTGWWCCQRSGTLEMLAGLMDSGVVGGPASRWCWQD